MRLKTKLVLTATVMTSATVILLSLLFLAELLRERIAETALTNGVVAREVLTIARQAIESGVRTRVRRDGSTLRETISGALTGYAPLTDVMDAIVRYSPDVQDVAVTDVPGTVLTGTDAEAQGQRVSSRMSLERLRDGSTWFQLQQMLGAARVLDVAVPLDRNGQPFLVVHVGVRSTFLRNAYAPFVRNALLLILLAGLGSTIASGSLSTIVLRPIEEISRRLEILSSGRGKTATRSVAPAGRWTGESKDAVLRVSDTIDRLGQQMRSAEEGYTALQANLEQMLDTLREGVVLFTPERRAVMVSDAVANFVGGRVPVVGLRVDEIFRADSILGSTVLAAFEVGAAGEAAVVERVVIEDGREVELTVDRFGEGKRDGVSGTMLTLRDTESAARLEQELEVSRRLAAIGQLTAGVGHEVKNPINAMVVHLELLKNKLAANGEPSGAQRHVEILTDEMSRLDGVVQTLADFSRPIRLDLREHDLCELTDTVVELTGAEMAESRVEVRLDGPGGPLLARVDGELIRQALLNLMLNAKQAMPLGGVLHLKLRREGHFAVIEVNDSGEGIAPEIMPRIFELYFTTKEKGSGIGLAMTYRILQMHRGALEVRSSTAVSQGESRGTTFTLRLPYAPGPEFRVDGGVRAAGPQKVYAGDLR